MAKERLDAADARRAVAPEGGHEGQAVRLEALRDGRGEVGSSA